MNGSCTDVRLSDLDGCRAADRLSASALATGDRDDGAGGGLPGGRAGVGSGCAARLRALLADDVPAVSQRDRRGIAAPARLGLSFDGSRVHRVTWTSGSTGVVVGATSIPNFERLPKIADGQLTYTSSGRIMVGQWVLTPLTHPWRDGTDHRDRANAGAGRHSGAAHAPRAQLRSARERAPHRHDRHWLCARARSPAAEHAGE